jgi:hypothetical protein
VLKLFGSPKNWKKGAPDFDLDWKNLQYFSEISERKPSKTFLLMTSIEITHNIAGTMAEFKRGGVLKLET